MLPPPRVNTPAEHTLLFKISPWKNPPPPKNMSPLPWLAGLQSLSTYKKGLEVSISGLMSTLQNFRDPEVEVWMMRGQSPSANLGAICYSLLS